MRLTVYLYRTDVAGYHDLVDVDWNDSNLTVLEPSQPLPFICHYLGWRNNPGRPEWPDYLEPYFHVAVAESAVDYGCLLVQYAKRWWALTFGQGYRWVREEMTEPDFGLLVTANTVVDDQLRRVDSRTASGVRRQRATSVAVPSGIHSFGVDTAVEWIYSISGATVDMSGLGQMTGAMAARFSIDRTARPLAELADVLNYLLDRFGSDDYRKRFGFLDHYRPIPPRCYEAVHLDNQVRAALFDPHSQLALHLADCDPHAELDDRSFAFRLHLGDGSPRSLSCLNIDELRRFLGRFAGHLDPLSDSVRLAPVVESGETTTPRPLRRYLVAETDGPRPLDGSPTQRFVLCNGTWFRVGRDFQARVERAIAGLPVVTDELKLPFWGADEHEEDYNRRAAATNRWELFDRDLIRTDFDRHGIEACDILAAEFGMIHVKRLESSAKLSHLFAQGSVAASLLGHDSAFRTKVQQRLADPSALPTTIVFALATHRQGPVQRLIPFFSKVNLSTQVRAIHDAGFTPALAKIEFRPYEFAPAVPGAAPDDNMPRARGSQVTQRLF